MRPALLGVLGLVLTAAPLFAATFAVNTTADTVDADLFNPTCADSSGNCSLRAAIQQANTAPGSTVTVPAGTYTLSIAGTGEDNAATGDLDIYANMTISGAGAATTIINANGIDRVFHIRYLGATATLQDLAIMGGNPGSGNGGGMLCVGHVTFLRCDLHNNTAGSNIGSEGGGFYLSNGSAAFIDSVIRSNTGAFAGGGISNFCASITITNSTLSGNSAVTQGFNSPRGGAIAHTCSSAKTWLNNVTIANNSATNGWGGGIYNISLSGGLLDLRNTIVGDNTASSGPDISGPVTSQGYNLLANSSGATITATTGDVFDQATGLSALASNGGPTMTQAIAVSSPAFDGGDPAGCKDQNATLITADQRGTSRPQAATCDIGAFEQSVFPVSDLEISKTGGATAVAGMTVTYSYSVTNNGPDAATGVTVADTPPPGLTFLSGTGGCASGFPWAVGNLALLGNAACTATFTVAASVADGASLQNTASVDSNEYDSGSSDDSSTATTAVSRQVDLTLTVAESADPITAGYPGTGNLVYTVTLTNNGPSDASGVTVTNTLTTALGVSFDSATPSQGSFVDPTWTVGSLAAGASETLTVTLTVDSTTAIGIDVVQDAATVAAANETLSSTGDDSDSESTSVVSPAIVTATKTVGGTMLAGGDGTAVYTIILSNTGNGAQLDNPGDEFTDVLPPSLTLVSATADSGTAVATVATNTVTWNGSIPPAGTVTITINAIVDSGAAAGDVISNQGTIAYDSDGDGLNEAGAQTQGPSGGATSFEVLPMIVPTLGLLGVVLLSLLVAAFGVMRAR